MVKTDKQLIKLTVILARKKGIKINPEKVHILRKAKDGSGNIYKALILDMTDGYKNYEVVNNAGFTPELSFVPDVSKYP